MERKRLRINIFIYCNKFEKLYMIIYISLMKYGIVKSPIMYQLFLDINLISRIINDIFFFYHLIIYIKFLLKFQQIVFCILNIPSIKSNLITHKRSKLYIHICNDLNILDFSISSIHISRNLFVQLSIFLIHFILQY
jgi:hypothetical protein